MWGGWGESPDAHTHTHTHTREREKERKRERERERERGAGTLLPPGRDRRRVKRRDPVKMLSAAERGEPTSKYFGGFQDQILVLTVL